MIHYLQKPALCSDSAAAEPLIRAGVPRLLAEALARRDIFSVDEAKSFLNPSREELANPFLLPDMERAVMRVLLAVGSREHICVYGDYDADGICATAILYSALRENGANVSYKLPSRHGEGYGLNRSTVESLAADGIKLIITVDNGISALEEIAYAHTLNVDVVVTDHHEQGDTLPDCAAVVAGSRKDSQYPNRALCGAGTAFQLARALWPDADHSIRLALAAIATIADIVPLSGENRTIVVKGLPILQKIPGVVALMHAAGMDGRPVSETTVAFAVAPRLNAAGRMGDATRALELFLSEEASEVATLADVLEQENQSRRAEEMRICVEAEAMLCGERKRRRAIMLYNAAWNPGVIGIVAARLVERYGRPAILFTDHDGILTGSGRCPDGINLYECLSLCSDCFLRFGGHAGAAGITMLRENFDTFTEKFYRALETYPSSLFLPACTYEADVPLTALDPKAVQALLRLQPFGMGNPEPVFRVRNVKIFDVRAMGKEAQHISAEVSDEVTKLRMVAFGMGDALPFLMDQQGRWDVVYTPAINRFHDKISVELRVRAISPSETAEAKIVDAFLQKVLYNDMRSLIASEEALALKGEGISMTESHMRVQYRRLRDLWEKSKSNLSRALQWLSLEEVLALSVFLELGFFTEKEGKVRIRPNADRRMLTESTLYKQMVETQS